MSAADLFFFAFIDFIALSSILRFLLKLVFYIIAEKRRDVNKKPIISAKKVRQKINEILSENLLNMPKGKFYLQNGVRKKRSLSSRASIANRLCV